ncbi:MAG: hypothetical protein ATN35_00615 [Epulopiscium sp. Nele67-Bin004]|nr:MAG: hypothetical protein ATN35_00615 [Epulopiscium sp. Nele67-Bin004]
MHYDKIQWKKNVIAIRDKDYQVKPTSNNIFYYDWCCLEMMLIYNDEVFESIVAEYYNGSLSANVLRETILEQLQFLSLIRKDNEQNDKRLKLRDLPLPKAFNENTQKLDENIIIVEIKTRNPQYVHNENSEVLSLEELLDITQGHDFTKLLATICNSVQKKELKTRK